MDIIKLLSQVKKVHFIGIGGAGMCPIAEILHSQGYIVSGSDNNEGSTIDKLRSLGIKVTIGQKPDNIIGSDMIVYSAAIMADNPELIAAKASSIPTFERAKIFGALTKLSGNCIAISGTHGKTTTTAFITQVMLSSGLKPSAIIGGKLPSTGTYGIAGRDDILVCEACEYVDTFLELFPDTAVILNVDADHLEYFKTIENIISSFNKFAQLATNKVIYNASDQNTLKAVADVDQAKLISFGLDKSFDYSADNIVLNKGFAAFDVYHQGQPVGQVTLSIPGEHNVQNCLAVIATCMENGLTFEQISHAIPDFKGAARRFEIKGTINGATVADDYAHHPKEVTALLKTARVMGFNKIWAIHQPFTYSRTVMLMDDFAEALQLADQVIITDIMGSREKNTYGVSSEQLAAKVPGSIIIKDFDEIAKYISQNAKPGDLVLTFSCGDIYKVSDKIVQLNSAQQ